LPRCDVYPSTEKSNRMGLDFVHGEIIGWLDHCHLLTAVISCEWQVAESEDYLLTNHDYEIREEMSLQGGGEVEDFLFKIYIMCTDKSLIIRK